MRTAGDNHPLRPILSDRNYYRMELANLIACIYVPYVSHSESLIGVRQAPDPSGSCTSGEKLTRLWVHLAQKGKTMLKSAIHRPIRLFNY